MSTEKENKFRVIWDEARQYLELNIEYAKLTAAEKVAILMTTVATALIIGVLAVLIFFFVSLAAVYWLAEVLPIALSYTIMAGFYVLILGCILLFRKQLLIDPVARFISRLFLK